MKRKMIFVLSVFLFLGFVSFNCYGQSNEAQRIVGTWTGEYRDPTEIFDITFNANGTYTMTGVDGFNKFDGVSGNWGIGGNKIYIEGFFVDSWDFFLSPDGKVLTLQTDERLVVPRFILKKR